MNSAAEHAETGTAQTPSGSRFTATACGAAHPPNSANPRHAARDLSRRPASYYYPDACRPERSSPGPRRSGFKECERASIPRNRDGNRPKPNEQVSASMEAPYRSRTTAIETGDLRSNYTVDAFAEDQPP